MKRAPPKQLAIVRSASCRVCRTRLTLQDAAVDPHRTSGPFDVPDGGNLPFLLKSAVTPQYGAGAT
jgi:hypothetical protein